MEYKSYILVPKDRVGVLIGKKGSVRNEIEKITGVKLKINGDTGEVDIEYTSKNGPGMLKAKNIITAIARGFSPEKSMKLRDDDNYLEIINMQDLLGKSKNAISRQKARVIGTHGRARKMLENLTHTDISVYGKTIGIIGQLENVEIAKDAIQMLVNGSRHGDVYKYIQRRMRALY